MEKIEDTSLLPNPIIVGVKSKRVFQFTEIENRDHLAEQLSKRLQLLRGEKPSGLETSGVKEMVQLTFYTYCFAFMVLYSS